MNILHINKYHYFRDGASSVYLRTAQLMESHGHKSVFFSMQGPNNLPFSGADKYFVSPVDLNDESLNLINRLKIAGRFLYSFEAKKRISRLLNKYPVDIAHIHNIYHHISPSILHELKRRKIPVVMSLHDYKMVCGAYAMLSNGRHCEDCRGGKYAMAIKNRCSKNSFAKSCLTAFEMYLHHKMLDIYDNVDFFITTSLFQKNMLEEMGFKKDLIFLRNYIDLKKFEKYKSASDDKKEKQDNFVLYIGRVSEEKGLHTLLDAAKYLSQGKDKVNVKLSGEGPIKHELEEKIRKENIMNVELLGYIEYEDLCREIKNSLAVILPSECYENSPLSVIEAFALETPVIGSRIAGIPELVKDNETGLTFESRNSKDLSEKIKYLNSHPDLAAKMGREGRKFVMQEVSAEIHYQRLMEIYERAKAKNKSR